MNNKSEYSSVKLIRHPLLWIIIWTVIIYIHVFNGDFLNWDDRFFIENKYVENLNWHNVKLLLNPVNPVETGNMYHPILFLSLSFDFYLWHLNPFGFHLSNFIMFLINIFFIYLVTMKLFNEKFIASMTALLFAIHPVHVEPVGWISARTFLLAGMFSFMSFYFFIDSFKDTYRYVRYSCSVILYICALLSQPVVMFYPVLLVFYLYYFPSGIDIKKGFYKVLSVIPYCMSVIAYMAVLYFSNAQRTCDLTDFTIYDKIFTAIVIFSRYMKLLLWPSRLCILYTVNIAESFHDYSIIISIISVLLFFSFVIYGFLKDRQLLFPLIWFAIFYMPVSNMFIFLDFSMADRYIYIASFGIYLLFSLICHRLLMRKTEILKLSIYGVLIIIISAFSVMTCNRVNVWQNSFNLWSDTVKKSPFYAYAHLGLGIEYDKKGMTDEAIREYEKVIELDPDSVKGHMNLSACYYSKKCYDMAILHSKKALTIEPSLVLARNFLYNSYTGKIKDMAGSKEKFLNISMEMDKYMLLGRKFKEEDNKDLAINEFIKALNLNPFCEQACYNLGLLYMEKGDKKKGQKFLLYLLELYPDRKEDVKKLLDDFQ
ncbi:MAG: photosystem I assembly protein Ycf3 [bacterium ADurb.Bin363]|nr:MAG: photosystem I assembly protein Ycf3 [bacterium ADurb.Bin363]